MRTLGVVLAVLVLCYGGYRWWHRRSAEPDAEAARPTANADVPVPLPRRELFTAPRAPIVADRKISEACRRFWNVLRTLDLAQSELRFPPPGGCDKVPASLAAWHANYVRDCAVPTSQQCQAAVYDYRAALTEELTKNTPLAEISDPKVLTDKMVARLRAPKVSATSVAEVAERLLETEPDLPQAARAAVTMRIQAAAAAIGEPDDPRWKRVENALELASRTSEGNSPELLDARLITEHLRYPDPEHVSQEAESISRQYPNLGVGPFHEAWSAFDRGDKQRAEELLVEAARREPRYQEALNELRGGSPHPFHPTPPSFRFSPQ